MPPSSLCQAEANISSVGLINKCAEQDYNTLISSFLKLIVPKCPRKIDTAGLTVANLTGISLTDTRSTDAGLIDANLTGAGFIDPTLTNAGCTGADLT
jgi:uncharacterized protein YjbI with pentapeptide repeats